MSDIGRIHHTGLTVSNLAVSINFYCDLLGCTVAMQQEKTGGYLAAIVGYPDAAVKMAHLKAPAGAHIIELFEYSSPETASVHLEPRLIGNAHLCFLVPDLEVTYDRLRAAGVDFLSGPISVDTGANAGGWGIYLHDPDGVTLELFQPANVADVSSALFSEPSA